MKRVFDIAVAAIGLVILSPVLAIVSALVRAKLGSPVLFLQQRPGLGGDVFTLIKFRTMDNTLPGHSPPLPDSHRLTVLGRSLRNSSLDELPELWNVLKGDMSIVGPRPLLVDYLPLYSERQRRRHEVRPGITGHAQVNGRNDVPWPERLEMDVWYVENRSFWLDMRIIAKTFVKVFRREGVTQDGQATVEYFTGNEL